MNISKITKNIYLGSILAFHKPSLFKELNIKYIISLRFVDDSLLNNAFKENIDLQICKLYISHDQFLYVKNKFMYIFNEVCSIIDKALEKNENVFIHCKSGQHRSSTILAGYFMKKYSLSWKEAFELIKKERPYVEEMYKIDENFNVIETN